MAAYIKRLQPKEQQKSQEKLKELQLLLSEMPELNEQKVSALLWDAKKKANLQEPNTWTFVMISPQQNRSVIQWIMNNSKRRNEAVQLWALLFENMHRETGQIMMTRLEIAKELNIQSYHVTRIMSELESIHAILKRKEGRGVIYYMNPNIANHYPQEIRNQKQKEAPTLKLIDGGLIKNEN